MLSVEEALTSLERMSQLPSIENFTSILQICRKAKNLAEAKRLRAYMCESGLEGHRSLGNYLVPMLVGCGSMADAQQVFNRLIDRNVYSWNSLITGYIECGESQRALNFYQKMQEDYVCPSKYTFVTLLKACGQSKGPKQGREVHIEIARMGSERELFVGSALVDMYAKCNMLGKALEVFDNLPVRDVVSWTALLAGYAEHGLDREALNCFKQMQLDGVSPDAVTFVLSLKACGSIGAIDKGQELHAEIAQMQLEGLRFVGGALVEMYAKCGSLGKAREVFDRLPVQDAALWTALVMGYAEHGLYEEALDCFEKMQLEGVSPDAVTVIWSLKSCGSIGALAKGRDIHSDIARMGLERDPFVGNSLVDMYAKCGALVKAQEVFGRLAVRGVVSWTALVTGYAKHGLGEEALNCFEQMQLEGVSPDAHMFVCSLKACGSIEAIDKGREIHAEIARQDLHGNPFIGNSLVDMYVKCGSLVKAQEVFDKLPAQDVVSWNILIAGYAEHELGEEAVNCFEQMQLDGMSPDAVTFVCCLKASGSLGAIDKGREIHAEIARRGLERDHCIGNVLIDMYAKCGWLVKAQEVFEKLAIRDVVSWTALITGCAQQGESEFVFYMLERMRGEFINPNRVTFLSLLTACSHAGLVDNGQKYFETMSKDYGITPNIEHYTCLVDLFGRAGQLDAAVAMVEMMPFQPSPVVWRTLLAACQKWGNVELGRQSFEHAMRVDQNDTVAYVLMSNIYVDAHALEDKKEVKAMRVEEKAWNELGQTWTEVGGVVHTFFWGIQDFPKANICIQS